MAKAVKRKDTKEDRAAIRVCIERMGGPSKCARRLRVRPSTVTNWPREGVPQPWRLFFSERFPHVVPENWKCLPPEGEQKC